ncbi:MAG TPA: choice-of-anchor Q domain-containing protein, partial [Acidimicrobiia bacterium]
TETHELLTGSPAIDAGPDPVPDFPGNEFDQRGEGFARVVGTKSDIGAFEVQPPAAAPESILITPKFTG